MLHWSLSLSTLRNYYLTVLDVLEVRSEQLAEPHCTSRIETLLFLTRGLSAVPGLAWLVGVSHSIIAFIITSCSVCLHFSFLIRILVIGVKLTQI